MLCGDPRFYNQRAPGTMALSLSRLPRLLIVDRLVLREVTLAVFGVLVVLLLVVVGHSFVKLLDDVMSGEHPPAVLGPLLAMAVLRFGVELTPLGIMLGVILGLGRLARDRELLILRSFGVGYRRLYAVLALLVLPMALVLAWLSLVLVPAAVRTADTLVREAEHRPDIAAIGEGRFTRSPDGRWVVFSEQSLRGEKALGGVFVHRRIPGGFEIETARRAQQITDPDTGERHVVLIEGRRYVGYVERSDYNVLAFRRHTLRVPGLEVGRIFENQRALPSRALLATDDPKLQAELQRRIAVPLAAVLLALLAVPLADTAPRQGRFGRVALGILAYLVYSNLNVIALSEVASGSLSPRIGVWWVQVMFLLPTLVLLMRRQGWYGWLRRLRRDRVAA
ncbi:MAG TPA: LPS export ABC transporter permease LptF [Chromatiales bacterium]|nr:LPS export ABC transporter permease LptF [Chromatiales bacterium]